MKCNATLTTATVERAELGVSYAGQVVRLAEDGNIVAVVTLHTLTCEREDVPHFIHEANDWDCWEDDTPGATQHADSLCPKCGLKNIDSHTCAIRLVTDREVEVALLAVRARRPLNVTEPSVIADMRAALEAFVRVREGRS